MKRKVRMATSLGGEDLSLVAGQEYELEEEFAIALVTEPADSPRAVAVGWEPPEEAVEAAREKAEAQAAADAEMYESRRGVPSDAETMEPIEREEEDGEGGLTRDDLGAAAGVSEERGAQAEATAGEPELAQGEPAGPASLMTREQLLELSRDQLNEIATGVGVEEPDALQNKPAVADAILEAREQVAT